MRTVPVALGARSYDVHVGEGALPKAAGLVPDTKGCESMARQSCGLALIWAAPRGPRRVNGLRDALACVGAHASTHLALLILAAVQSDQKSGVLATGIGYS